MTAAALIGALLLALSLWLAVQPSVWRRLCGVVVAGQGVPLLLLAWGGGTDAAEAASAFAALAILAVFLVALAALAGDEVQRGDEADDGLAGPE